MASLSIPPEELSTAYLRQYGADSVRNVSYAFIFITIAVVGLRLYARKISNTKYGVDDILAVFAATTVVGVCIKTLVGKQ